MPPATGTAAAAVTQGVHIARVRNWPTTDIDVATLLDPLPTVLEAETPPCDRNIGGQRRYVFKPRIEDASRPHGRCPRIQRRPRGWRTVRLASRADGLRSQINSGNGVSALSQPAGGPGDSKCRQNASCKVTHLHLPLLTVKQSSSMLDRPGAPQRRTEGSMTIRAGCPPDAIEVQRQFAPDARQMPSELVIRDHRGDMQTNAAETVAGYKVHFWPHS